VPLGVFVTGTDTDVGKTVAAACLAAAWNASYWKPVQTGLAGDRGDSATVAALARLPAERVLPPAYEFQAPLSPHAAAAAENAAISLSAIRMPDISGPIVVEGAGGVLVPLDDGTLMADLIRQLGLPAVLVTRTTLGTINHTLLSLEALRARGIAVAGAILNGAANAGNRDAIVRFGRVRILAELPRMQQIDADAVRALAARIPPLSDIAP